MPHYTDWVLRPRAASHNVIDKNLIECLGSNLPVEDDPSTWPTELLFSIFTILIEESPASLFCLAFTNRRMFGIAAALEKNIHEMKLSPGTVMMISKWMRLPSPPSMLFCPVTSKSTDQCLSHSFRFDKDTEQLVISNATHTQILASLGCKLTFCKITRKIEKYLAYTRIPNNQVILTQNQVYGSWKPSNTQVGALNKKELWTDYMLRLPDPINPVHGEPKREIFLSYTRKFWPIVLHREQLSKERIKRKHMEVQQEALGSLPICEHFTLDLWDILMRMEIHEDLAKGSKRGDATGGCSACQTDYWVRYSKPYASVDSEVFLSTYHALGSCLSVVESQCQRLCGGGTPDDGDRGSEIGRVMDYFTDLLWEYRRRGPPRYTYPPTRYRLSR